jgi:hypothetical protein
MDEDVKLVLMCHRELLDQTYVTIQQLRSESIIRLSRLEHRVDILLRDLCDLCRVIEACQLENTDDGTKISASLIAAELKHLRDSFVAEDAEHRPRSTRPAPPP